MQVFEKGAILFTLQESNIQLDKYIALSSYVFQLSNTLEVCTLLIIYEISANYKQGLQDSLRGPKSKQINTSIRYAIN